MDMLNITLIWSGDGFIAHTPECAEVDRARRAGKPLMTMLECERGLPEIVETHSCLKTGAGK